MVIRQLRWFLPLGLAAILHAGTGLRAAGQGTYYADLLVSGSSSAVPNGLTDRAVRMPATIEMPDSNAGPSRKYIASQLRSTARPEFLRAAIQTLPRERFPLVQASEYYSMPVFDEMESSFRTLDTPFNSAVRLSLGTIWKGRIRLAWFADSRALDNVMLGLPVAGVVNGARLAGGGTLQFEEDTYGVQLMFRVRRSVPAPEERDALRGLHRAYRVGRTYFLR